MPPERLLKASLLIALYSVRSERAFCEELDYNLLFRWFLQMDLLEPSFDATTFTKNRSRFLEFDLGQQLFDEVLGRAHERDLLSDEHFTVDGTLIEACASLKSFKRKDGDPPTTTDDDPGNPSGRLSSRAALECDAPELDGSGVAALKKGRGKEAKLSFMGHALMENRNGLLVDFKITAATGTAERDVVPQLIDAARDRYSGRKPSVGTRTTTRRIALRPYGSGRLPPRSAERHQSAECDRWPDHAPPGLRDQSTDPEARRRDFRLDEDRRWFRRPATGALTAPGWLATWSRPPTTWCGSSRLSRAAAA